MIPFTSKHLEAYSKIPKSRKERRFKVPDKLEIDDKMNKKQKLKQVGK